MTPEVKLARTIMRWWGDEAQLFLYYGWGYVIVIDMRGVVAGGKMLVIC